MVWAAVYDDRKSRLIPLIRDSASKQKGYTTSSYIEVISEVLPEIYAPDLLFQQDNAPIHTSKASKAFLRSLGIPLLEDYPPYSPDLNPIEHLWALLKKTLYQQYPDIETWKGTNTEIGIMMAKALCESWDSIDPQLIEKHTQSMVDRVKAVIEADGWYTRY